MSIHKKSTYFFLNFIFIMLSCSMLQARLTEGDVMAIGARALFMIFILSAPMLFGALALGLVVAVLQALTSVQEQSLGFVPKLLITFALLIVFGPWISATMMAFTKETWTKIIDIGNSNF